MTIHRPPRTAFPAPPTGSVAVDLKLARAHHHRADAQAAIDRYIDSHPYRVRQEERPSKGVLYRVVVAEATEPPPSVIQMAMGDFVHNLRSALDCVIGAMRPEGPTPLSAFPLCTSRTGRGGFDTVAPRRLEGIPDEARAIIESMQQYVIDPPERERQRYEALAILDKLWNIEKHRTILVATSLVLPAYVGHNRSDDDAGIGHRIDRRSGLAEWWLPIDEGDQRYEPHFEVEVRLDRPRGDVSDWPVTGDWEADGVMDYMFRTVSFVVMPQLKRFIQPGF